MQHSTSKQENRLTFGIVIKALTVWLGILVLAIANGALREAVIIPRLGQTLGFTLSGALLSLLILVVAYLALPWIGRASGAIYIGLGLGWLCLTLVFEFTFGRLVQGRPWPELLDAYSFKDGNIWPVVLFAVALAPYVAARIRSWT